MRGRTVDVELPSVPTHFYRHGWQSWSETRWRPADAAVLPIRHQAHRVMHDDPVHASDTHHGGSGVGAVRLPDGQVVALVCLGVGGWVSLIDGRLHGDVDQPTPGEEVYWTVVTGEETAVFDGVADALGTAFGRRTPRRPRAWCSWYSMYTEIDQTSMRHALDGLADLPFEVFQIDDGWQHHVGDWQVRTDRFPDGLDALADRIHDTGRQAGLWLAPFLVHEASDLATTHPEWLLHDDDGSPVVAGDNWGGALHALDVSRPDVLEHVEEMIATAVGWGFEYLKLDFLYAGALPGAHHVDLPREVVYRNAIRRIRLAAGEDTYLLACGAPLIASLGVFDGARVGPDVNEVWDHPQFVRYTRTFGEPNTRWAIATSAHRLWLQSLWDCDPDVAYFRNHRCLLTPAQKQLLQDLATITGFRGTSDPPAWLTTEERRGLDSWLRDTPSVTRRGNLQWRIDDRDVDFGPVATADPNLDPVLP